MTQMHCPGSGWPAFGEVLALLLPRHLHLLPKAVSDGHQPLGLPRRATRETHMLVDHKKSFDTHMIGVYLRQIGVYLFALFSVLL